MNPELNHANLAFNQDLEIDLKELTHVLWQQKWAIIIISAVITMIGGIYILSEPDIYQATTLLAPATEESNSMSQLASQYGGLASLTGIKLPKGGGTNQTALGLEVLQSRAFLAKFIEQRNLLAPLTASLGWDSQSKSFLYDSKKYDPNSQSWLLEPSMQSAYSKLKSAITIAQDENGFVTLTLKHVSPQITKDWLSWLVEDLNQSIRQQDVNEAERSIAYLKDQVQATGLTELQSVFFELIQSQTKTIMLANVRPEYLFKTIDPPVIPETPTGPKRKLIIIVCALFGGLFSIVLVLVHYYFFKRDNNAVVQK